MRPVKSLSNGETSASARRYPCWVRRVGLALAVSFVIALALPASAQASTSDLVKQLDGLVSSFPGGAGIWIADPTVATPLFAHDAEEQVIAASLYKLGVLAEALTLVVAVPGLSLSVHNARYVLIGVLIACAAAGALGVGLGALYHRQGPAIVTEYSATSVVPPEVQFKVDTVGNLVLQTVPSGKK